MKLKKMVFTRWRIAFALTAICLVSVSCEKDLHQPSDSNLKAISTKQDGTISPFIFDWETSTYLPSASTPGANPVQMPWNGGTSSIDPNLVSDYKKVDGWELMYNTFAPDKVLNDPNYYYYFALYNRYRGQLRFYLWQPASPVATSYVNHGLKLYSGTGGASTSPMLNFNAVSVVDQAVPQTGFSMILNQQINASGGTWFLMQYEMAYDPNLSNTTFPSLGLTWASNWISVATLKVNGTNTGTIKGTLGNPNQPEFSASSFIGSFIQKGVATLFGAVGSGLFLDILDGSSGKPFSQALTNAASGQVSGFLSGLIGGYSGASSAQPITLTMDTKVELSGSIVSNGGLEDVKLPLPGQANGQTADGNVPASSKTMGVFTLSAKPIVRHNFSPFTLGPYEDPQYGSYYEDMGKSLLTLDATSFSLVWNPAIINSSSEGATIQNVKREVVLIPGFLGGWDPTRPFNTYFENIAYSECCGGGSTVMVPTGVGTNLETMGRYTIAVADESVPLHIEYSTARSGLAPDITAVRISFDVVPNSGAPSSKVVKTFWADVQP